jgi:hypothetical protein
MQPQRSVPPGVLAACLPLHKTAFGVAVGLVAGLGVVAATSFHLLTAPAQAPDLVLLAQFFPGYSVSWTGAAAGFVWSFFTGFLGGWLAALIRNLSIATWWFATRAKAELFSASDFIGHV